MSYQVRASAGRPGAAARGPAGAAERAIAPDLARGAMLLFIVLANTGVYMWSHEIGLTTPMPDGGSPLDRIVQFVLVPVVDGRAYPMFSFLLGYGIMQLYTRQRAAGTSERDVRAILRRRNLWLLAFGAVHALLLYSGDILGPYGLAGLVLIGLFLHRGDRTLLAWCGGLIGTLVAVAAAMVVIATVIGMGGAADEASGEGQYAAAAAAVSEPNVLSAALHRMASWVPSVPVMGLLSVTVPAAILLGFWAARNRILEEPQRHLPLLRTVAIAGIGIGWLGGVPNALFHVGALPVPESLYWAFMQVQPATGFAAGMGYVAVFGLIAHRLRERPRHGHVTRAITATGKRSMSCYLAQSVICAPVLAAWGLGLGGSMGSASMLLFATGVWAATVVGAYALELAGRRGPAEIVLRRLAYRAPSRARHQTPAR